MSCDKNTYATKDEAKKDLNRIQKHKSKSTKTKKFPVRYYKCDLCGFWHLTSQEDKFKLTSEPVKLTRSDEWNVLLRRQNLRDDLYTDRPFENQIQKALSTIFHNINIQCDVLSEKFQHQSKNLRTTFNRNHNKLYVRLRAI